MRILVWIKKLTINQTIVLLQEIASYVGEGAEIKIRNAYLEILADLSFSTETLAERQENVDEVIQALTVSPLVEKVEKA